MRKDGWKGIWKIHWVTKEVFSVIVEAIVVLYLPIPSAIHDKVGIV